MATIAEMQSALDDLISSEGAELTGLDFETVVSNYVETYHVDELSKFTDSEERQAEKERLIEIYREKSSNFFNEHIATIKMNYLAIQEGCTQIAENVTSAISSAVLPSVITVGTATSTANPAYTVLENAQKKNNLLAILKNLCLKMAELLRSAINIAFEVPDAVITLITTLTTTKTLINTIS